MKSRLRKGFTLIELLVVITIIAILASLSMAAIGKMGEKGQITKSIANCRQIIIAIRLFAADEGGRYPDQDVSEPATTANMAFRNLIKAGSLEDEKIFGSGAGKYVPDGNIGTAPQYDEAVKAGECHWMMTGDLNDSSAGAFPSSMRTLSRSAPIPLGMRTPRAATFAVALGAVARSSSAPTTPAWN